MHSLSDSLHKHNKHLNVICMAQFVCVHVRVLTEANNIRHLSKPYIFIFICIYKSELMNVAISCCCSPPFVVCITCATSAIETSGVT